MKKKAYRILQAIAAGLCLPAVTMTAAFSQELLLPQDEWTQQAVYLVTLMHQKKWAEAHGLLSEQMAGYFQGDKLADTWEALEGQAGRFRSIGSSQRQEQGDMHIVDLRSNFEVTPLTIRVVIDSAKKVSGLWFLPAAPPPYDRPSYVDTAAFREVEITFGEPGWGLPGTLTIPIGSGPFPGVVLVHGSGPNDRDETIGPNRPFRDLAWGLATQGIAVLRYDKRTKVHGLKMKGSTVTVDNEVIVDALIALDSLRMRPEIRSDDVFLLGHSLGATLAPEIAERDGRLAGAIMLAAVARPLGDVVLDQINYIASLKTERTETETAELDTLRERLELLRRGELDPQQTILFAPAAYFYDLRKRDEVAIAAQLTTPLLILQGGRDYQATTQDFELWEQALRGRKNVTMRLHDDLNHLFFAGEGKATPEEYSRPGHVDLRVLEEIASWIESHAK